MNAIKYKLAPLMSALLVLGCLSLGTNLYAEDDDIIELDSGEDLEYIEMDEIMDQEEALPDSGIYEAQQEPPPAAPAEEEEFVDLNNILYGDDQEVRLEGGATKDPATMQQEMQDLKEKILQVNRDLFILEEDLLFPSSTQVNVFVSYDSLEYFQLDGITLKFNDRPISNHLYTERELAAMNRGAVQRLFTGNLPVGEHELIAIVTGIGPQGRDYRRAVSLDFDKSSGSKYIELIIEGDEYTKQPGFRLKQWE